MRVAEVRQSRRRYVGSCPPPQAGYLPSGTVAPRHPRYRRGFLGSHCAARSAQSKPRVYIHVHPLGRPKPCFAERHRRAPGETCCFSEVLCVEKLPEEGTPRYGPGSSFAPQSRFIVYTGVVHAWRTEVAVPWNETDAMDQRCKFVMAYARASLRWQSCARLYGVSRPTGYKWVGRHRAEGVAGLKERSRAARHCPHRMSSPVARWLLAERRAHPQWGPRKLLRRYRNAVCRPVPRARR